MNKKGFTLLELLVVVLIIGILAGIALPQYKKAVEKSRMAEAVMVVKSIAQAQQRYYLIYDKYADCLDFNSLDMDFSGEDTNYGACAAKKTKKFIFTSSGEHNKTHIALAQTINFHYYIYISKFDPNRIRCASYDAATDIQRKLCSQLDSKGRL